MRLGLEPVTVMFAVLVGFEPFQNCSVYYKAVQNVLRRYMGSVLLHHRRQFLDIGIRV